MGKQKGAPKGSGLLDGGLFRFSENFKGIGDLTKNIKSASEALKAVKQTPVAKGGSARKGNEWSRFLKLKYTQYGGKRSLQSLMRDPAIKAEYAAKYKK